LMQINQATAKQIDGRMPEFFGTLPRLSYGVVPMPDVLAETGPIAYYFLGNPALGHAGNFLVNTARFDQRPLYEVPVLTLHEAVPGHHHQFALAQEIPGASEYRKNRRKNKADNSADNGD